ncbi:predicted protein [Phaeodactylum tricornutum CCAP 1055/1]|uniref:MHD domain-containing protein n=2 Tax=Phaeodactylum tricornutum TaxID=2850 RepID=B7FQF9_PHATC|nr:predicted protein [Phaeodactylum tricornutum CCAP 1055/1]EEC51327.1 predicted protein [Phaeodactylum tricornutum CCAP 1055/1]|eukprot:XP_002176864.1 predicted protein [Phaeodactylum tricornutum CCAP 1055/1]
MQLLHSVIVPRHEFVSFSIVLGSESAGNVHTNMAEPVLISSALSTMSTGASIEALKELHLYIIATLKASVTSATNCSFAVSLISEAQVLFDTIQTFHPKCANGLGLHYRYLKGDTKNLAGLISLILPTSKGKLAVDVAGVLLTIGSSATLKWVLSTFLLLEDDSRKTNAMVACLSVTDSPDVLTGKSKASLMNMQRLSRRMSAIGGKPSTDHDGGQLSKEEKASLMIGFNSADSTRLMTERLRVLSASENNTFLRQYRMSAQERKAHLDLTGSNKSRFRRRKSDAKDPDFDGFEYKGLKSKNSVQGSPVQTFTQEGSTKRLSLTQSKNDSRTKPLGAPRGDVVASRRLSNFASALSSGWTSVHTQDEASNMYSGGRSQAQERAPIEKEQHQFDEEGSSVALDSVASQARVHVNIALNEDLSCSYKQSQLVSCAVEGVVQVQVITNDRKETPFFLFLKDVSSQVESLQENKKFANEVLKTLGNSSDDDFFDRKYSISVPQDESYFPILRYKCISELRPVPIRVQTRVKIDDGKCRVALQISSNPNNEAGLTDLTIIMGVPEEVIGESLATQPPGGVWNQSKRSVIWVVSELGDGEKFQLQVRFEVERNLVDAIFQPTFPVLVRCQCLFSQLSDIELEVREDPARSSAAMGMKIARRFRLSHRERP